MPATVILVDAAPRRAADGISVPVRLAGGGAAFPYHYGNQHYRAGLGGLPTVSASLDFDGEQLGGGGTAQAMELRWAPARRAALAAIAGHFWPDAPITVRIGREGGALPPVAATGLVVDAPVEAGVLRISLADDTSDLKRPLLVDRFAGTGGIEGPAEWNGQIKSRAWGRCFNVPGRIIHKAANIACFGDPRRQWGAFDQVRTRGVAIETLTVLDWQGSPEATFAALVAKPVPAGAAVACPSIACVKWWTEPDGDLHADIRGETAGGYVETAPAIAARIIAARSALPIAAGELAAAEAARPAPFGWRVDTESATAAGEVSELLAGVSLSWVVSAGQVAFRPWQWGAPRRSAKSHTVARRQVYKPVASRKLGYRRNWSPMARGDLAAIVLARDIVYEDGTPIEDLKPAQPGADVTGENTSKDTNSVGGKPATDVLDAIDAAKARQDYLETVTIPAVEAAGAAAGQRITEARAAADLALDRIDSEVERVDGRIDYLSASGGYDDTAVNARITDERELSLGRDAALGTRIDTVTASVTTTDTNLRALITTKETAAVGREDAISQRIDQLIAEGGGGSEGVDTVARSEISRVEQASVQRDTALSSRNDTLQASANGASGALNPNQDYRVWPENQPLPTDYNLWSSPAGIARPGTGININNNQQEGGIAASVERVGAGWYVYEAEVYLHTYATFLNTGLTMNLLNDVGTSHGVFISHHFYEDVGHGQTDRWYHFTRLVNVPDLPERNRGLVAFHVMGKWSAFSGSPSTNNTTWRYARIRPASDAEIKAGKADATLIPAINARVKTTEDALADAPNRFASAQRASNIEAAVGGVSGRVNSLETVTSNGTFATSARAEEIVSYAAGISSRVDLQAGTIAGLGQKTAAYVRVVADAGNGRASLSLWSDQYGGAWQLTGDGLIVGNVIVDGTVTARKFDGASMAREASTNWTGNASPNPGQTINILNLALPSIPPTGRFIYEYTITIASNVGTGYYGQDGQGRQVYTTFVADGGGVLVQAVDPQGHVYTPRPNASDRVMATADFAPLFTAIVRRGTRDQLVNNGDGTFTQYFAATFTVTRIDLKVTWVAV